ncbi:hypothetical protein IX56_08580 [Paracoccus sanguinis]|uniref:Secreted protein n=1 Tax=Paracoccus sanguinis TaxID=1545044 RepID=A0A099GI29_9RHOB|nr:hypothetical protein IX56_08580 [Paracoccus sanguinis]
MAGPPVSALLPSHWLPAAFAAGLPAVLTAGAAAVPADWAAPFDLGSGLSMLTLSLKGRAACDWRAAVRVCRTRSVTGPVRSRTSASPETKSCSTGSTAIRSSRESPSEARSV